MKAPSLRLIALLTCLAVARSHAIDLQPPPSGNGISDVYEWLYPGLIYNDDPLTGDVCQPIREDITVGPYTNREKALLGVAPTVSLAMPLTMQIATGGTAVILRFPTVRGKRYQVQRGEVVPLTESNWITVQECGGPVVYKSKMVRTPVGGEIIGTGDEAVVTLAVTLVPGEPQYFSYTCLGDIFSDTDALSDWEESILGTNPLNPDTDGDGLLDDWEYVHTGKFGIWPSTISLRLPRNQTANAAIHLYNDTTSPVNYSVTLAGNTGPSYGFEDSVSGTVAYTWEEISTTGTKLENISDVLDGTQPVDLVGFSFPFYGNTFSRVHVSNNGFVTFGTPSSDYINRPLPSTSAPANLIAAFWDDLDTRTIGDIYYKEESNRLIIQYENVGRYGGGTSSAYTFQIVLFADGRIQFRYKSMVGVVNEATIGVQDSTRTIGLQVVHNAAYVANELTVEINPQSSFLNVSPASGTVPANTTFALDAVFRSLQLPFGTYTATITTSHDAPEVAGPHTTTATLEVFNAPATVALTAPAPGTEILQGDSITLTATATDPEGMQKVEFYNGSTKLGERLPTNYSFTWNNPPVGTHTLSARAIDIFGGSTTSSPVTITVLADSDGDRMPDAWEIAHGLNPNDPSDVYADTDGDRIPNLWEYFSGTDPNDPNSKPEVSAIVAADGTADYLTLQQAYDSEPDRAIIEVRDGTYNGLYTWEDKRILWLARATSPAQPVTITPPYSSSWATLVIYSTTAFDGFAFRDSNGYAAYIGSGTVGFINCLFSGNSGGYGAGAIYADSNAKVNLVHCTIIGNGFQTNSDWGGAAIYADWNSRLIIRNSILWNPSVTNTLPEIEAPYATVSVSHSIIRGGQHGAIDQAPALAYGGWMSSLSPARQTGEPGWSVRDIHGEPRPTIPAPDLGCDQFQDSNSNGLPDWLEAHGITDPNADHDGDGLSNLDEFQTHGTNLLAADTDGDGLSDGDEVLIYVTDPLATDTDDDGFSDGNEVAAGTNPADPESHPALAKYITRTLQYDFDDYQNNRKGVLLVNALWDGSLDKNIPLTDEIPETTLATRAETEIPLPTELPPQARRATLPLEGHGSSVLIPNPPCYHASLTHHRVWLKRGGAQDSAETRNFIIVTERTIDGVEQDIKARAATLTIPAGQTISSESITLQESFTENFSGNSSRYQTFTQTLLPVEVEIIHNEIDPRTGAVVSPGKDSVLRDEIVDLRIKIPPLGNEDWTIELDVDPAEMRTQQLGSRGNVLMFDFGEVEGQAVTPITADAQRRTVAGQYEVVLRADNGGEATIKAVFNKEGTLRIRLKSSNDLIDTFSQEITVKERIRKFALFTAYPNRDPNQYDVAFEDAAAHWKSIYQHEVDTVDRLKAMGMAESYLGANPTAPQSRPDDILTIGNPGDNVLNTLTNVPPYDQLPPGGQALREVDIPNNSTKMLSYPNAAATPAATAILYGTCWLYQKTSRISNNPNPPPHFIPGPWRTWDDATVRYNGGGVPNYLQRVHRPLYEGRDPFTPSNTLWPRLTNDQPRREPSQ